MTIVVLVASFFFFFFGWHKWTEVDLLNALQINITFLISGSLLQYEQITPISYDL